MTTCPTLTTLFSDSRCDGEWDGEWDGDNARISLYGKTKDGEALIGQVILTRHTVLLMHNAVAAAINGAFRQPKAKVSKFRAELHAVKST